MTAFIVIVTNCYVIFKLADLMDENHTYIYGGIIMIYVAFIMCFVRLGWGGGGGGGHADQSFINFCDDD